MTDREWWVYLLDCDGRLYTGVSTDPERRFREHVQGGARGARFTRGARRLELRYAAAVGGRGEAQSVEYRLKQLTRKEKQAIIRDAPSTKGLLERLKTTREADVDRASG
jgi:putative endonuclease